VRLRRGLARRPILRSEIEEAGHRHASWLELFFDLAYVAAIGQLSAAVAADFSAQRLAHAALVFVPMWWAWVGQAFYLTRFDSDDLAHRLFALLNIGLIVVMAVNVPAAVEGIPTGFVLCYAAVRGVLIWQYLSAGHHLPQARPLTTRYAIGFALAVAIWLASLALPWPAMALLWGAAILVDLVTPFTDRSLAVRFKPDFSHIPERFGLFTIIVLGEAILATVAGLQSVPIGRVGSTVGVLGLVTAFAVWWIYFEGVRGQHVQPPKAVRDVTRIQVWLYSHLPLAMGIVAFGIGYKKAMLAPMDQPIGQPGALIAGALCLVMLAIHGIYRAGLNSCLLRLYRRVNWPHNLATALIVPAVYAGPNLTPLQLTGWLTSLMVFHVLLTMRDLPDVEALLQAQQSPVAG
jgi:low temperature requirement protein LtrA